MSDTDAITFLICAAIDEYRVLRPELMVMEVVDALRAVEARLLRGLEESEGRLN